VLTRRQMLGGSILLVPLFRARVFATESCTIADPNELGPFYRAGSPQKTSLCDAKEPGDPFLFEGRVLSDCRPVAGALIEVWHADTHGVYDMLAEQKPRDPNVFHLRAMIHAGKDGSFAFDTVIPGHYATRAKHLHFAIHADGHEPFITQGYFAGDSRITTDSIARPKDAMKLSPASVRGRTGQKGQLSFGLRRRRPVAKEIRAAFADYEGRYRFPGDTVVPVVRVGDSLFSDVPGYDRCEMFFDGRDRFRVVEFDATGQFERAPDGKITGMVTQSFGDRKQTHAARVG
jgi:catechol 1,2-dioxygenase